MRRGRAHGGMAALIVLAVAAIGVVALLFALVDSGQDPPPMPNISPLDAKPLVRIEDKTITSFDLKIARQYAQLRAGKEGFVMPDHGILRESIEHAAFEVVLARYNRGIGPDDVEKERIRQIQTSKDRETLRKIQDLLDPYPGQFEKILVRPPLASQWIRRLHQDRAVQEEAYQKADAALKEAVKDPDAFFKSREGTEAYTLVDSDVPPKLPPGEQAKELLEEHKKRHSQIIIEFAKKALGHTKPGELCPNVVDAPGEYVVARLKELTDSRVRYEQVSFRKSEYDVWFNAELLKLKGEVVDPETRDLLKKNIMDTRYGPWLFPPEKK